MWVGLREIGRLVALRWPGLAVGGGVVGALWLLEFRLQTQARRRRRERRMEEELAAYARLNTRLDTRLAGEGGGLELAGQVSRLIAEKSSFHRAAMLVRDAAGKLVVAASAGMDDAMVQLLNAWGEGVVAEERVGVGGLRRGDGGLGVRVGGRSFSVVLGKATAAIGHSGAIVTPLWTAGGRMLGALAVGADGVMSVRRSALAKALAAMEALAFKVERAMENAALEERLLRAEKLAGLGLMAGGMAHALNNPLTAVLGFAELIAATSSEGRVKEDAGVIVREALRMRETVETLREFSRPAARGEELVDVAKLMRELAVACAEKLESRGVRLVVQAGGEGMAVRGSRERLRQMMEHLLNNAAQALAGVKGTMAGEEQAIRVSVSVSGTVSGSVSGSGDGERIHLVVSDTGPGFAEPGRVFEPCDSLGLGLSVCYGIVHEHGGEISAFNLHPHGAAVAVELPVDAAIKKSEVAAGDRAYSASV
jgi:signal transduction histidine kinase